MQNLEKYQAYFEAIEIGSHERRRAEGIIREFDALTGGKFGDILDIFVGNYVSQPGNTEYDSLWLFAKGLLVEAQDFADSDQFRLIPLRGNVSYFELKKRDFSFEDEPNRERIAQARMRVVLKIGSDIRCEINAARKNCQYLAQRVQHYVLPNIQTPKSLDSRARSSN